ncbi:MAG TPA: response regulator [Pseudomonadales bacterium]|nr:response regulator [Pseudomonadales bacterium]
MSEPSTLFPYYFPTTAVFVDDNASFLRSLALELPADLAYQMFESAEAALAFVNRPAEEPPLYQRCFSHYRDSASPSSQQLIHLDLSLIEREVSNANRFREISVVVVDYDMPGMDGLEFCRRIDNPRIRKVLFTGVADEKIAVRAFNAGIIDRFIIKSQSDAVAEVRTAVSDLQRRYFEAISETLRATLMLNPPPFLADPEFEKLFARLRAERNFAEYYLVAEPDGFLLLTDEGALFRLVVLGDAAMDAQVQSARRARAPAAVIEALEKRTLLGYFYESVEEYFDAEEYEWEEYLVPATRLDGNEHWYWALIESPPVDIDFDEQAANYMAYLDRLDREASAA